MAGQWLTTQVEDGRSLQAQEATQRVTVDLPRSNFLGALVGRLTAGFSAGSSPTVRIDVTRVQIIANGSAAIVDLTGDQLAALIKYEQGRAPTDDGAASTSPAAEHFFIPFGRGRRDETMLLPAKAFKTLQLVLELSLTSTGSPTIDSVELDLAAEEWVSNDSVQSKLTKRTALIGSETITADEVFRQSIPLGNNLRAIYVHAHDPDNLRGAPVKLLVNGGSEIPFTMTEEQLAEAMLMTYRFHDETIPQAGTVRDQNVYKLDFDVLEDLRLLIDTSQLNDLDLEVKGAASGVSGDVEVLVEEVVGVS